MTPVTVNRELAALARAFTLGVQQQRLSHAPRIVMLREALTRQGFLDPEAFERVARMLPESLGDLARFAYRSGWRKGEVTRLTWSDVDRAGGRVVLRRELSKNGEPRVLPLEGQLRVVIERRWRAREYPTPTGEPALALLVFHDTGRPIHTFRKAWATACRRAGVAGTLFHDLRRSAVRNLDRAGVSQTVAMAVSGHKTASVYPGPRYRIVDEDDLRAVLARTEQSLGTSAAVVTPLRAPGSGAGR